MNKTPRTNLVVRGVVDTAVWDEDTETVMVVTDDDEEYLIEPTARSEKLLDHVDMYVEITGEVWEREGLDVLSVRKFREIRQYDSSYDDDEDSE